ncbi:MAG: Hsp20/alpha crystallin family protein [Halodesulfovibrio sp.]
MHHNQSPERCGKAPRIRPAADFVEREDGFYLYLDMPGVRRQDLVVHIEEDELTIQAASSHGLCGGERVHAMEFGDVEYFAQFSLTDTMDKQRIGAQLENGVLSVYIPRREAQVPRRIKIEVL